MGFQVLVIEDNVDGADTLGLVLRQYGFDVRVAYNGSDGVEAARAHPPDAVLCDIAMPGMDGFAVAERLGQVLPRRPLLVAVTACLEQTLLGPAARAGFDHYFLKPADPAEVGGLLASYADQPAGCLAPSEPWLSVRGTNVPSPAGAGPAGADRPARERRP